jgi:hypothetical protein
MTNTNGGQHAAPIGDSTWHGQSDEEYIERLRRTYGELDEPFDEERARRMITPFDPDQARDCEAMARRVPA